MSSVKNDAVDLRPLALRVRKFLAQSQDGFAKQMGVSKASVQNWESRRGRPAPAALRKMAGLAPQFGAEIQSVIDQFEYHRKPEQVSRRYSGEAISLLHQALDIVIDRAPSTAVEKLTGILDELAGRWGDHPERAPKTRGEPHLVPIELNAEVDRLAKEQGLDTSFILRDALSLGLAALSSDLTAKRQSKINREAQRRAHPRS